MMKIKKNLSAVVLMTLCLVCVLFTISPILSSSTTGQWNPWADVSGDTPGEPDGLINMKDIAYLVSLFNAPPNGTNIDRVLYYAKQSQIDNLTLRIDNLNASLVDLRSEVEGMNATNMMPLIDSLNASLIGLQSDIGDMNLSLANEIESRMTNDSSLNTYISTLNTRVDSLNATIVTMNAAITLLQTSNADLNSRMSALEAKFNALGANNSVTNLMLAPYAIPFNMTYDSSHQYTTETASFVDMPYTSVTLTLNRTSQLLIMFSADAGISSTSGGDEKVSILCQAEVNGIAATPDSIQLTPLIGITSYHSHRVSEGAFGFNFYFGPVNAGTYTIKIRWYLSATGTGDVWSRTLEVIGLPA